MISSYYWYPTLALRVSGVLLWLVMLVEKRFQLHFELVNIYKPTHKHARKKRNTQFKKVLSNWKYVYGEYLYCQVIRSYCNAKDVIWFVSNIYIREPPRQRDYILRNESKGTIFEPFIYLNSLLIFLLSCKH